MPIAFEPQENRMCWLLSDADKPKESRPMFTCAAPTRRIMAKYWATREEMDKLAANDEEVFHAKCIEAILLGVTGWVNFKHPGTGEPIPFNAESLLEWLTDDERAELLRRWPVAFQITEEERKKSLSPSPSGAASSVPIANTANA